MDPSNCSISLVLAILRNQQKGNLVPDDEEKSENIIIEENKEYFWSMSGDFICRHHDVPRLTVCVPTEEEIPIPMKHVDVVGQTRCCRAHSERLLELYVHRKSQLFLSICVDDLKNGR